MHFRPDTKVLPGSQPGDRDHRTQPADSFPSFVPDRRGLDEEQRLLKLAGKLLVRAQDFERRIAAVETASQACRCAKAVSTTVVDILEQAKALLTRMREAADPEGRRIMAASYNAMLRQIDAIADTGYYESDNLARADHIQISTDEAHREGFRIAGIDMGCSGLELRSLDSDQITNAEIIDRLSSIETASNKLLAHSYSYDSIAALLQSRMKFARGMVDILEDGNKQINHSRAGHDAIARAVSEICRTVANDDAATLPDSRNSGAEPGSAGRNGR